MRISAASFSAEPARRRLGLGLFASLAVVPPLIGLGYALAYSLGLVGALATGFTGEHWAKLLRTSDVTRALGFSFAVAAVTVMLATAFALGLSLALRGPLGRGVGATALFVPLALPGVVAALIGFQFLGGAGVLSRLASHLGWIAAPHEFPALIFDQHGFGIALTHTALAVPFLMLLFARFHANERIDEFAALARTLGANRLTVLRRVTLPLLLRRAAPSLSLLFAGVFGSYEIPLLLGAQRPEMISILARRKFALFDLHQRPEAFLIAVVYAVIVLALVFVASRKQPPADVG